LTEYDYVIVGAGSAGCLLAHRLAQDPGTRVLLVEAGSARSDRFVSILAAWPKLLRGRHDWCFFTEPRRGCAAGPSSFPAARVSAAAPP